MFQLFNNLQRIIHGPIGFLAFHTDNRADAARIMFKTFVIKARILSLIAASVFHGGTS